MSLLNSYVSPSELQKDIQKARKSVHTDGYSMSIGELVNLYDDKEMDIRPEFQRLFRWNTEQKSKGAVLDN